MKDALLRNARLTFALAGVILSLGAPVGWHLYVRLSGDTADSDAIYLYLTIGTMLVFTLFGAVLGHLYSQVRELATRDDLTGLFNQGAFLQTAEVLLQLAIRHNEPMAFMMMDIDHFKDVNDNNNHLVGSHVLKEMARIIVMSLRKSDLTARFGGDEYVFCLPRTPPRSAAEVGERIRRAIEGTVFTYRGHSVKVTVSIGVAAAHCVPGLELPRLLELADQALYEAKDHGRNQVSMTTLDNAARPRSRAPTPLNA